MDDYLIEKAKRIREFEIKVLEGYRAGIVKGTIHCCIGQELQQVRIIDQLQKGDIILSNHRGHGHFLAYTENYKGLWDELCGLQSGVNKGRGLSQHLHQDNFYNGGIQGGMLPMGVGMALSFKKRKQENIVLAFISDGTLGQGILYECLNLISLWDLPMIIIIENNEYAMSTPISKAIAGDVESRFKSFGLKQTSIENIRGQVPGFLHIRSYRFCGHSGSDVSRCYRPESEERTMRERDVLGGYLLDSHIMRRK